MSLDILPHFHRHGVTPWPVISMQRYCKLQVAVLSCAKTLPFVLEDITVKEYLRGSEALCRETLCRFCLCSPCQSR